MSWPALYRVTPYYAHHLSMGAEMFLKGGWARPKVFKTVEEEVLATRQNVGLIDAHSMGKITICGKDAHCLIQYAMANDLDKVQLGKGAIYSCLCSHEGMIIDDVIIYAISAHQVFLITNTLSGPKVFQWLTRLCQQKGFDALVLDDTNKLAYIALQGPACTKLLDNMFATSYRDLNNFEFGYFTWEGVDILLARTGYTGELGYELIFPSEFGYAIWGYLLTLGEKFQLEPIGGEAVQCLRIEKAYRAYGSDMTMANNPYEAGLGWSVCLKKDDFVGRTALQTIHESGISQKIIGYELSAPIATLGENRRLMDDDHNIVGKITSLCDSPTLGLSIAMAMVEKRAWPLEVLTVGDSKVLARKTSMPFYDPLAKRLKTDLSQTTLELID